MVELYCFVAHAQHNASRTIEGEALRKEANSAHFADLNMTENQQDREDSSRDMETERQEGSNSRALEPEPQKGLEHE